MRARLLVLVLLAAAAVRLPAMDVGFEPRPGSRLPMDARMLDESDRPVSLRAAADGKPWVLVLGYFNCPNLCDTVRADLIGALRAVPPNLSFGVAAVSVDSSERVADVNQARIHDAAYQSPSGMWRYLRTDDKTLTALTQAAGFRDRYDSTAGQIAHPAGLVFVTPQGQVSSYLLGVGYRSEDVTRALEDAAQGRIATAPPAAIALLCFDYDASTGRYSFVLIKLLRALAVLTVAGIAGSLVFLFRSPRVAA